MSENENKELACVRTEHVDVAADIARFAAMGLLPQLLTNHSTGGNIVWASSVFDALGDSYAPTDEILVSDITGDNAGLIRTRASKAKEAQTALTRAHAEVFTPTWVCKLMIDEADAAWDEENPNATWRDYVSSPRLEITCGEAPYLVGRYDAADGTPVAVGERVGILDRKLSRIPHYFKRRSWVTWATNALKSTYGYEFQGDNLLIARVNVLATIEDYAREAGYWPLTPSEYRKFVDIISWNLWQMDGLSDCVPFGDAGKDIEVEYTPALFDVSEYTVSAGGEQMTLFIEKPGDDYARVYDWENGKEILFRDIKRGSCAMKFDYVIGNPPYQDETLGDNAGYAPQIYNLFMSESYQVGSVVELITPARFLFNAGSTPKAWNKAMLKDEHLKVLWYEPDAAKIFPNTDIKGGVAVTLRDANRSFGAIGVFSKYVEMNAVQKKVKSISKSSFAGIIYSAYLYHLTNKLYEDHPELRGRMSRGHEYDLKSNVFETIPEVFHEQMPDDEHEYVRMLGRAGGERVYRYIRRDYLRAVPNIDGYKIALPKANGAGRFGEVLSSPVLMGPGSGSTETFLSVGIFGTELEAKNALSYLSTKFCRALLGILKVTQDLTPGKFEHVPLQDFTSDSDIDWSQSIDEIDQQLFEKYGLEDDEVAFIKTHVKEMS